LQEDDAARFKAAAVHLFAIDAWDNEVETAAMAWARKRGSEQVELAFTELRYTENETRGAKEKRPHADPEAFKVPIDFHKFTVQKAVEIEKEFERFTVHNGKLTAYRIQKNGVQTPKFRRDRRSEDPL
jgi:hypothetical protein